MPNSNTLVYVITYRASRKHYCRLCSNFDAVNSNVVIRGKMSMVNADLVKTRSMGVSTYRN